ncbi:hypothetical protein ACFFRR_003596 [Megaselia abdita]
MKALLIILVSLALVQFSMAGITVMSMDQRIDEKEGKPTDIADSSGNSERPSNSSSNDQEVKRNELGGTVKTITYNEKGEQIVNVRKMTDEEEKAMTESMNEVGNKISQIPNKLNDLFANHMMNFDKQMRSIETKFRNL